MTSARTRHVLHVWRCAGNLAAAAGIFLLRRYLVARERSALASRERLTDVQIYASFYAGSSLEEDSVLVIWHEIAQSLSVDPGLLRPDDEIGRAIGANWLTSSVIEDLEQLARKHLNESANAVDIAKIRTLDDFVRAFACARTKAPSS